MLQGIFNFTLIKSNQVIRIPYFEEEKMYLS